MKRLYLVVALLSCALGTYAVEYEFGIGIGYSGTFKQADFSYSNANISGCAVAPSVHFFLSKDKKWLLRIGASYHFGYRKYKEPTLFYDEFAQYTTSAPSNLIYSIYQEHVSCHTLSFPVRVGYEVFRQGDYALRLLFGPELSYQWGMNQYTTETLQELDPNTLLEINGTIKVDLDFFENPFYCTMGVGLEACLGKHLYLQAMFDTGLFNKAEQEVYAEKRFCYQERLQILFGCYF